MLKETLGNWIQKKKQYKTLLFYMCAERWEKFQQVKVQNDIRRNMKARKCNFFLVWMEHSVEANGPEVEIKSSPLSSLLVVYS